MESYVCADPQGMHLGDVPSASLGVYKAKHIPALGPPCLPAKLGLHLHTPSSELWFAVVSGNPPGRSESPCPRTVTGGGDHDGEVGRLGAASAEWGGEVGERLPITPFPDILVGCKQAPHCCHRGKGLGGPSGSTCSSYPVGAYPSEVQLVKWWYGQGHLLLISTKACVG